MLCGDLAVMQASGFDSLSFDPFSLFQDDLTPSEVDIGRGQIIDALVIAVVVVVIDEGFDLRVAGLMSLTIFSPGLVRVSVACLMFHSSVVTMSQKHSFIK